MNKEALWNIYCARNPKFGHPESEITLTGAGLKKLFDQTYDMAYSQARDDFGGRPGDHDLFGKIFGGKHYE